MIDAGVCGGTEHILVTESELNAMDVDEWALFQRMMTEPIAVPGTSLEFSRISGVGQFAFEIRLIRETPCVTTMGDVTYIDNDDAHWEPEEKRSSNPYAEYFNRATAYFTFPTGGSFDFRF